MPIVAIILDAIAVGGYVVQDHYRTPAIFIIGLAVQIVLTVILLGMTFSYGGKRRQTHDLPFKGYHYTTLRYAIIIFSMIINAVATFLYLLNFLNGGSSVLFQ